MTLSVGHYICTGTGTFTRTDTGLAFAPSTAGGTSADAGQVTVVADSTPHAVGAWVDVFTGTLSAAGSALGITLRSNSSASTADSSTLLDIGIDAAGGTSYSVVVDSVGIGFRNQGAFILIPCPMPSGARVAVRTRSVTASKSIDITGVVHTGPTLTAPVSFGADTANSRGVVLGASAGPTSFSSWSNIGSTTAQAFQGVLISAQGGGDATFAAGGARIEIGWSSTAHATTNWQDLGSEALYSTSRTLVDLAIPSGVQLQARWCGPAASGCDVVLHCIPA